MQAQPWLMLPASPNLPGVSRLYTLRLAAPESALLTEEIATLRALWAEWMVAPGLRAEAVVVLPGRLMALLTIAPGLEVLPRWRGFRAAFAGQVAPHVSPLWAEEITIQPLDSPVARNRALAAIWDAPVRAGLVRHPEDWPFSSLQRDLRRGGRGRQAGQGAPRHATAPPPLH